MILVTGSTGFLGKQLVEDLLKEGYSVRLLSREREKTKELFPRAEVFKGDILDRETLEKAANGAYKVIHLAGLI